MSLKYRIRLSAGRIIGPFTKGEVEEVFQKKHINGNEECQLFPVGPWENIQNFSDLRYIFRGKDNTLTEPLKANSTLFQEFKFSKDGVSEIDYSELEEKFKKSLKDNELTTESIDKKNLEIERTIISNKESIIDIDKTRINTNKAAIKIKENSTEFLQKPMAPKDPTVLIRKKSLEELVNESTQFIDLKTVLPAINTELRAAEIDYEQKENLEESQERIKQRTKIATLEETIKEDKSKKVGMKPIIAFVFIAIIYMLLNPDDTPVSSGQVYAPIQFPITLEFEDASKANLALQKGLEANKHNSYRQKILAAQYFSESLQNQFRNNPALGELILNYAELHENAKDLRQALNVIYKLMLISENKTFSDVKVVTGSALFYEKIRKSQTGVHLVKNFFRAKGKPTPKLLGYYLELLISAGELSEASKVALRLNEVKQKPPEAYLALSRYFESDEKMDFAESIIDEGLSIHLNNIVLLLRKADFLLKKNEINKFEAVLKKCSKFFSEFSPVDTAKFYKQMGFLSAIKNKNKEASAYFKKSLAILEADDLRAVLASLEIKGDKFSQALILESKIIELMKKADLEIQNRNFEAASTFSVEAVDADPDYLPAVLQHVRIQLERGLIDAAIFSLNRLLDKHPLNNQIKKMLIETDLKALKFDDAQKGLIEISKSRFGFSDSYASLMARFFEGKKSNLLAIRWYGEALARNPLSDFDMFRLANMYFKIRKYDEAKKQLVKALTLDPKNVEYISLQADILYDQDSADVALGYLRDAITELGDDPLLVSNIAKIYYKNGQQKEFQTYYKKIQSMPKKDEKFFEFLIYASKLEDNKVDMINYSKELLKINPGNVALQIELAEFYMNSGNYQEAMTHLGQIEEKVKAYPRLHYLLSKIALKQGDLVRAKDMADKEKLYNPGLELSFIMLGEIAKSQKDYREALNQYEKALSLNPKSVDALLAMASIRLSQNHSSEALDLLLLAIKYDKNNPEISKQLGFAFRAAGQRSQGKERFEDYLKLNPGAQDREQIEALIRSLK
jgi:tetratricopeptide (TPR) repeat protein